MSSINLARWIGMIQDNALNGPVMITAEDWAGRMGSTVHFIGENEITECGETNDPIITFLEYQVTCPECLKSLEEM